jgi:hypothetical protein
MTLPAQPKIVKIVFAIALAVLQPSFRSRVRHFSILGHFAVIKKIGFWLAPALPVS